MFETFSVFHFLVYATCFGFIAAIVYTNIQRTALSKFVTFLIQNKKFDENSAVTLSEIRLSSFEKNIIKSAVKNQNGLKRCITVIKTDNTSKNSLEIALEGGDDDRYYITDSNTEELLKKYSYKTLSTKYVILFIVAFCVVVILATAAVNWLINKITIPEIEESDSTEITETQTGLNTIPDDTIDDESTNNNETIDEEAKPENPYLENENQDGENSGGPRIPVLK